MFNLFKGRKAKEDERKAMEFLEQTVGLSMNIHSLTEMMARHSIKEPEGKGLEGALTSVVNFIARKCLKDAGYDPKDLNECQTMFAMTLVINIADPVTQFTGMQEQFEFVTSVVATGIFMPYWMKDVGSLFNEASTNYNSMSRDEKYSVITNTVGKATWAFLQSADEKELEPVTETFRMLLPSVGFEGHLPS